MTDRPRILAFSGSIRKGSLNQKLADLAADAVEAAGGSVTRLSLRDHPMPIYDGDLEAAEGVPAAAVAFRETIFAHHGVIIASPEYNSGYTPLLKNALDWATRGLSKPLFHGKVVALVAASGGPRGGYRSLTQLREALALGYGALVLPEMVSVPNANATLKDEGVLADERSAQFLKDMAARLVREARHATEG